MMNAFLIKYLICWLSFCLFAGFLCYRYRKDLISELPNYRSLIFIKWKLVTFSIAFIFVTFAGHFTDDETWDIISGGGMSVLTFFTAPWAVGTTYKVLRGQRPFTYLIIAAALTLFSASWFYDGYLLLRDGSYTGRWIGNLILSPIIYVCAGLLWNLEASGHWFRFSFLRLDWPKPPEDRSFWPILIISIPLILVAAYVLIAFVGWRF